MLSSTLICRLNLAVLRNSVSHACSLGLNREEYLKICSKEFDLKVRSQKLEN
jgi:hypothetical protein